MQYPPNNTVQLTTPHGQLKAEKGPITVLDVVRSGFFDARAVIRDVESHYLHVPFCFHKCHYCDFYSIVDSRDRQAAFTDRLVSELQAVGSLAPLRPAQTIFIGGGTPTLLAVEHWQRLLNAIADTLRPDARCEFTVEANPETVTPELAAVLKSGGVNRVSIGAQSFNATHLQTLERWHDPLNVCRSVDTFRDAGIHAINLDLIFAIPGQTMQQWQDDLDQALALKPSHMSCYGLTYEPNTPMTAKVQRGLFQPAEQDLEAAMYSMTMQRLAEEGYEHYEISAWARPGQQCRHNLQYWSNANWWPYGPSASGHVDGVRWKNIPRLGSYLESKSLPPIVDVERVDADGCVGETLMLGLRMIDGIALNALDHLLTLGQRGEERRMAIERHSRDGLLEQTHDKLRLTRSGLLMADTVLADLI